MRFSDRLTGDNHSLDGSATDSGRGGSEEGDGKIAAAAAAAAGRFIVTRDTLTMELKISTCMRVF